MFRKQNKWKQQNLINNILDATESPNRPGTLCESQQGGLVPWLLGRDASYTADDDDQQQRQQKLEEQKHKNSIKCKGNLRCKQLDTTPSVYGNKKKTNKKLFHSSLQFRENWWSENNAIKKCATQQSSCYIPFLLAPLLSIQPNSQPVNHPTIYPSTVHSPHATRRNESDRRAIL